MLIAGQQLKRDCMWQAAAPRRPPAFRLRKARCRSVRSDIAAAVDKPFWFQLYVMKDRGFIKALIERAIAAKCSALVLTVDLQVIGQRHQDIKNGMTVPPEWSLSKLIDFATKPTWVSGVLRGKRRTFGNLVGHLKGTEDITALSSWINSQFDTT